MNALLKLKDGLFSGIDAVPQVLNVKKLPSLNGLRAVSILIVIYRHAMLPYLKTDSFLNGDFGVAIFFVISGFLITTLLLKEQIIKGSISLKRFFIRRALRILPLAYLYLFTLLILNAFGVISIPVLDYLSGFFYFNNWYATSPYIVHYWSLSIEEQFYMLFPFLLKKLQLRYYIYICLLLLLAAPMITYMSAHEVIFTKQFIYLRPLIKFHPIVTGSLLAIVMFKGWINFERFNTVLIKLSLAGLIILAYKIPSPVDINKVIFAILIAAFIAVNIYPKKDPIYIFLNSRLMNYIGLMSYSLYIWQELFTFENMPWKNAFPYAGSIAFNLTALFVVAYLSYNYFEKPFLKLKKKYK